LTNQNPSLNSESEIKTKGKEEKMKTVKQLTNKPFYFVLDNDKPTALTTMKTIKSKKHIRKLDDFELTDSGKEQLNKYLNSPLQLACSIQIIPDIKTINAFGNFRSAFDEEYYISNIFLYSNTNKSFILIVEDYYYNQQDIGIIYLKTTQSNQSPFDGMFAKNTYLLLRPWL